MKILCECGCGEQVKWSKRYKQWNRFIDGHSRRGKKHTKEAKIKIGRAGIGRVLSKDHKAKLLKANLSRTYQKQTPEQICNHAIALMKCRTGEGGYCDQWYDFEYRNDLRGSICEICGVEKKYYITKGHNMINHHIDGNKMNCHPSNFKTLCRSCHMKVHYKMRKAKGEST